MFALNSCLCFMHFSGGDVVFELVPDSAMHVRRHTYVTSYATLNNAFTQGALSAASRAGLGPIRFNKSHPQSPWKKITDTKKCIKRDICDPHALRACVWLRLPNFFVPPCSKTNLFVGFN